MRRNLLIIEEVSHENYYWALAQLEIELQRFLAQAALSVADPSVERTEEASRRFDILWSRVNLLLRGEMAERVRLSPHVAEQVDQLRAVLQLIDEDGGMANLRSAYDRIERRAAPLRGAVVDAMHAEAERYSAIRSDIAIQYSRAIQTLLVAVAICFALGAILVWQLARSNRELSEMRRLARAAEAANRAKAAFLTHVNHEVRTPLNAVFGLVSLARLGDVGASEAKMLGKAQQSCEALADLLDYALATAETWDGASAPKVSLGAQPPQEGAHAPSMAKWSKSVWIECRSDAMNVVVQSFLENMDWKSTSDPATASVHIVEVADGEELAAADARAKSAGASLLFISGLALGETHRRKRLTAPLTVSALSDALSSVLEKKHALTT